MKKGFSLVEVMVAVVIMSMFFGYMNTMSSTIQLGAVKSVVESYAWDSISSVIVKNQIESNNTFSNNWKNKISGIEISYSISSVKDTMNYSYSYQIFQNNFTKTGKLPLKF